MSSVSLTVLSMRSVGLGLDLQTITMEQDGVRTGTSSNEPSMMAITEPSKHVSRYLLFAYPTEWLVVSMVQPLEDKVT